MTARPSRGSVLFVIVLAGAAATALGFAGQLWLGAAVGLVIALTGVELIRGRSFERGEPTDGRGQPADPSRRRFLQGAAASGVAAAAAGAASGELLRRATQPLPSEIVEAMASDLGSDYMNLVRRGYFPGRSGDLQLVVGPGSSANYEQESKTLVPRDPRTSHATVWNYLERIPLVVYSPQLPASEHEDTDVTLADIAPTTAELVGTSFDAPDGRVLPGVRPLRDARVVVTFVIDGGGWNVLNEWPDAWPNLKRLMQEGVHFPNARMGSFPAVTACAHATIGTGAFPATHGVSGHFLRHDDGRIDKAFGEDGEADTTTIIGPTFAEQWAERTGGDAWVGEVGYQIWHLAMLGRPARSAGGSKPLGIYFAEKGSGLWESNNPDYYDLPSWIPSRDVLEAKLAAYTPPEENERFNPRGGAASCCSPPIIEYQGDLLAAAFENEPIGEEGAPASLLTTTYKAPDYTGHIYNMQAVQEEIALRATDAELGRMVADLERRFGDRFAVIVTADHGQCPLPDDVGGVRLDPLQLEADINRRFGDGSDIVESIRPSEIFMIPGAVTRVGTSLEEIAAWLKNYTYGSNYEIYEQVDPDAVEWDLLDAREFAAVLPSTYVDAVTRMGPEQMASFGDGAYAWADTDCGLDAGGDGCETDPPASPPPA